MPLEEMPNFPNSEVFFHRSKLPSVFHFISTARIEA